MRCLRRKLLIAAVLFAADCISTFARSPYAASAAPEMPLSISEIGKHVAANGWPVDLKTLCAALEINIGPRCLFLQIALHNKETTSDDHGFNVPADSAAPARLVLYHVTPLTGEFFLATFDGKLLKALYRSRGNAFETMPAKQALSSLRKELEFWHASLGRTPPETPH
jgi:hypothetical protein